MATGSSIFLPPNVSGCEEKYSEESSGKLVRRKLEDGLYQTGHLCCLLRPVWQFQCPVLLLPRSHSLRSNGEQFEPLSDDGKAVLTHEWRKIINGLDHAEEAAKKFEQILRASVNKKLSSRRHWQAYVYFRARTFN
jgi:hypothetical protein